MEILPSNTKPPEREFGFVAWIAIMIAVALGILKALIWSHGLVSAEVFGYAVAGGLVPFLIAYAIAGRQKVRNSNIFARWLVALSVLFLVMEFGAAGH